jgi:hypothetical protein
MTHSTTTQQTTLPITGTHMTHSTTAQTTLSITGTHTIHSITTTHTTLSIT